MRIGIDARFYGPQGKGLGRYTQKLISHLEKIDRVNNYFILLRKDNWQEYQPASSKFIKVLADYRWYSLAEQLFLPWKINSLHLDLMHFTHFNVPLLYRGKFIVTIHDLILTKYPTERATTLGPLLYWVKHTGYQLVIKRAIQRAKKIIAVSRYTKQDIVSHFNVPGEKVCVTYEAVEPAKELSGDHNKVLKKYGVATPYLLHVGNVYPHKNVEGLLAAFKLLRASQPECSLVLVGKDDYFFSRLKKEVGQLGLQQRVFFTGFVDDADLPFLYKNASAYVFPSFYEGFGLPALEACAYGVPVVASRSSCLPEILGDAALYFDPNNTREMAEKIAKVIIDPQTAQNLRKYGYQRISLYSWDKMASDTLDLYSIL